MAGIQKYGASGGGVGSDVSATIESGNVESGAYAAGSVASGAFAAGSVSSGAFAAGSVASGAFVDGALLTLGLKTDAKATATDTTSVSGISIWKQISASVQTAATVLGSAALTRGAGAVDSNTLRVTIDSTQTEGSEYEDVAKDQTAQVIGSTGAIGDFLSHITIVPETTSPGAVSLLDNTASRTIFTGGASSVSNLVPFTVSVGAASVAGAWKITTGTNVHVIAFGNFT